MTITIESIKAEHSRLAEMIAALEAQAKVAASFPITISAPTLKPGELYVGAILSADGKQRHHIILLPGDNDSDTWDAQMKWAKSIGGDLPNRCEQALLFATMRSEFKETAYWSNEKYASDSDYAWYQHFDNGDQDYYDVDDKLRSRAVRRLVIL